MAAGLGGRVGHVVKHLGPQRPPQSLRSPAGRSAEHPRRLSNRAPERAAGRHKLHARGKSGRKFDATASQLSTLIVPRGMLRRVVARKNFLPQHLRSAAMFGVGPLELLFVLLTGTGTVGAPLGLPPLEPDATIERAVPAECLLLAYSAGTAEPDAQSTNQTEQLLAEPEVQEFLGQLGQQIVSVINQASERNPQLEPLAELGPAAGQPAAHAAGGVLCQPFGDPGERAARDSRRPRRPLRIADGRREETAGRTGETGRRARRSRRSDQENQTGRRALAAACRSRRARSGLGISGRLLCPGHWRSACAGIDRADGQLGRAGPLVCRPQKAGPHRTVEHARVTSMSPVRSRSACRWSPTPKPKRCSMRWG